MHRLLLGTLLILGQILLLTPKDTHTEEPESYCFEKIHAACMSIWTQLDLLSAIRTSHEDLQFFGNELIDQLLDLRHMLIQYNQSSNSPSQELYYLCSMMHQISDQFEAVFSTMFSKEISCARVLLERILVLLEDSL